MKERLIAFFRQENNNKSYLFSTLLFAFFYEFILGLQGFDFCDEGWVLTSYQQIFNEPWSIEYNFLFYLTVIIGGIWDFLFGFGGILSFRILTVITIILTIYFTYLTVEKFVDPLVIPLGTFIILLLHNIGITVFHHNHLTFLLVSISIYLILRGLNEKNFIKTGFGFFIVGINVFSRIPNITMLSFMLLPFVDFVYNKEWSRLGRHLIYSILGFMGGVLLIIALMLLLGHWEIFKASTTNLIFAGSSQENSHSIIHLIKTNFGSYIDIYKKVALFVFTCVLFGFFYNKSLNKLFKVLSLIIFSILILIFFFKEFTAVTYYSFILFPLLISYFYDYKIKSIVLLNSASIITMFFLPLGSDFGIGNMGGSSIWLATFVSIAHILRYIKYQVNKKNYAVFVISLNILILFTGYELIAVSKNTYSDPGNRLFKTYKAKNEKFTIYTSKEKSDAIDDLLFEISKYVSRNDYLLCFESLAMIHYLTETKPYMGTAWPWIYDPDLFKYHLDKAVKKNPLPIVLRQKCQPIGGNWTIPIDLMPEQDDYFYKRNRIKHFEEFLSVYNYKIIWENDLFLLYDNK